MELGVILRETFQGWRKIGMKVGFLGLIMGGLQFISSFYLTLNHFGDKSIEALEMNTLIAVLTLVFDYVLIVIALKSVDLGKDKGTFYYILKFFSFWLISLIVGIMVILGFVLLIVPGVILAIIFGFAIYANIEQGKGVGDSLSYSHKITKNKKLRIFLVMLLLFTVKLALSLPISSVIGGLDYTKILAAHSFAVTSGKAIAVMLGYIVIYVLDAFSYVGISVVYKKLKEDFEQKEKQEIEVSSEI